MNIESALNEYRIEENFFAPEYDAANAALNKFRSQHIHLTSEETDYLKNILEQGENWPDKYFVADLLYLYDPIPDKLLAPMLRSAIQFDDPSFNRIFLKPCIKSYGLKKIEQLLDEKEREGDASEKEGVARLRYWLRSEDRQ